MKFTCPLQAFVRQSLPNTLLEYTSPSEQAPKPTILAVYKGDKRAVRVPGTCGALALLYLFNFHRGTLLINAQ